MFEVSPKPTTKQCLLSPEESQVLLRNWILYQNHSFGKLQLGDVLNFLECLKQENQTPFATQKLSLKIDYNQHQNIAVKWNNAMTVARIKSLLENK